MWIHYRNQVPHVSFRWDSDKSLVSYVSLRWKKGKENKKEIVSIARLKPLTSWMSWDSTTTETWTMYVFSKRRILYILVLISVIHMPIAGPSLGYISNFSTWRTLLQETHRHHAPVGCGKDKSVGAHICKGPRQEWRILAVTGGGGATIRSVPCFVPLLSPIILGKGISGFGDLSWRYYILISSYP